ncbi:MAG: hypothetical protein KAX49_11835 [Halanaerobiales bacterium]|nr:hypothetical protein [Halanaerobiales bacterium]
MKVKEYFEIFVDNDRVETIETEEEVKEKIENWINSNTYLEDELLDLAFTAVVSSITIKFVVEKV